MFPMIPKPPRSHIIVSQCSGSNHVINTVVVGKPNIDSLRVLHNLSSVCSKWMSSSVHIHFVRFQLSLSIGFQHMFQWRIIRAATEIQWWRK